MQSVHRLYDIAIAMQSIFKFFTAAALLACKALTITLTTELLHLTPNNLYNDEKLDEKIQPTVHYELFELLQLPIYNIGLLAKDIFSFYIHNAAHKLFFSQLYYQ